MAERLYSDGFIFWVKAALALQITKEGLCSVIEKTMTEFERILSNGHEDHLRTTLIPKLLTAVKVHYQYASKRGGEKRWKLNSKCTMCCSMFERILENHTRKHHPSINWQSHDTSEHVSSTTSWWIIAKIFMPGDNRSSKGPTEVDPLALFSLIMNCKLFSTLSIDTQEVIDVRNMLMHHSSNTMSELEMKDAMSKMKKLLTQDMVKETSKVAIQDIERLEQERIILTTQQMVDQALYLKKESLEFDKQELLITGMPIEKLDLELQKTEQEIIVKENYFNIDEIERLSNINSTLQENCIGLQKNYDCEHQIRTQLEEMRNRQRRRASLMMKKSIAQQKKVNKIKVENIKLRKGLSESENWRKLYINERAKGQQFEKENKLLLQKVSKRDEQVMRNEDEFENLNAEIKQMKIQKDLFEAPKETLLKSAFDGAITGGSVGLALGLPGIATGTASGALVGATNAALTRWIKHN